MVRETRFKNRCARPKARPRWASRPAFLHERVGLISSRVRRWLARVPVSVDRPPAPPWIDDLPLTRAASGASRGGLGARSSRAELRSASPHYRYRSCRSHPCRCRRRRESAWSAGSCPGSAHAIGAEPNDGAGPNHPEVSGFSYSTAGVWVVSPVSRHKAVKPSLVPGQYVRTASRPARRTTLRRTAVTTMASSA